MSRGANEVYPGSCGGRAILFSPRRWLNCFTVDRKPRRRQTRREHVRVYTPANSTRSLPSPPSPPPLYNTVIGRASPSLSLLEPPLAASPAVCKVKDLIREPVSIGEKRVLRRRLRDEDSLYMCTRLDPRIDSIAIRDNSFEPHVALYFTRANNVDEFYVGYISAPDFPERECARAR